MSEFFYEKKRREDKKSGEVVHVKSNRASDEGTAAHTLAEWCLKWDKTPLDHIDNKIKGSDRYFDKDDMTTPVMEYVNYCRNLMKPDSVVRIEEKIEMNLWNYKGVKIDGECFGTADCVILNGNQLEVIDLKYGKNIWVDANHNSQGMLYAFGCYKLFKSLGHNIDRFRIHIVQPRMGNIDCFAFTIDDLRDFMTKVADSIYTIEMGQGVFKPSQKGCMFCINKKNCEARNKMDKNEKRVGFTAIPLDILKESDNKA